MPRPNSIGVPYSDPDYQRKWREVNKERLAAARKEKYHSFFKSRRLRRAYWINKFKIASGCTLCGYDKSAVALDFDHLDPKEKSYNISHRLDRATLKSLIAEIRKCRVLCANCHRIETHGDVI